MPSLPLRPAFAALLCLAFLPFFACDTAGLDSAEALVVDAQLARQAGKLDQAVALLEKAHVAAPESPVVRAELARTLLQREGLGLVDIDQMATFLMGEVGPRPALPGPVRTAASAVRAASRPAPGASCTYASDPEATPFDPREAFALPRVEASRETIERTLELLAPVIPAELKTVTACSGIESGRLSYDRASAMARLRGRGLTAEQASATLAVNAVSRFFKAYLFVADDLADQTTWYHVRRPDRTTIGVCATDEDALRTQSEAAVRDLGEAVASLDLRATQFGAGSASGELVRILLDTYEDFRDVIGPYCSGSR